MSAAKSPLISKPAQSVADPTMCDRLLELYETLRAHFGPRNWWPGDSPFEVVIGAILTQNTAWTNVEKAILNLKNAEALSPEAILSLPDDELAALIRPSGYFNQKALRLKTITRWFIEWNGLNTDDSASVSIAALRERLLGLNGVGEETADSILLYACSRTVFVIDAYTRRIMSRLGHCHTEVKYFELQDLFTQNLPFDRLLFNDYHAQFVALGKDFCRPKPHCDGCPVKQFCHFHKDLV